MAQFICINLERRPDRRASFLDSFTRSGLDTSKLHWLTAIDGSTLPESSGTNFFRRPGMPLPNVLGRVACYLSHLAAIEKAIEMDVWPTVIFEDDVIIDPRIHVALHTLPSDHFLYLGGLPVVVGTSRRYRFTTPEGWHSIPSDCRLYGGHAYCLTDATQATTLRDYVRDRFMGYDGCLIRYQQKYPTKVYTPFVANQSGSKSDIDVVKR